MGEKRGRPKSGEMNGGTRQVRIHEDLADMLGWIIKLKGGSVATILDPLIRPQITAMHRELKPAIDAMKKAQEAAAKVDLK
jgi:hypothetical protein